VRNAGRDAATVSARAGHHQTVLLTTYD